MRTPTTTTTTTTTPTCSRHNATGNVLMASLFCVYRTSSVSVLFTSRIYCQSLIRPNRSVLQTDCSVELADLWTVQLMGTISSNRHHLGTQYGIAALLSPLRSAPLLSPTYLCYFSCPYTPASSSTQHSLLLLLEQLTGRAQAQVSPACIVLATPTILLLYVIRHQPTGADPVARFPCLYRPCGLLHSYAGAPARVRHQTSPLTPLYPYTPTQQLPHEHSLPRSLGLPLLIPRSSDRPPPPHYLTPLCCSSVIAVWNKSNRKGFPNTLSHPHSVKRCTSMSSVLPVQPRMGWVKPKARSAWVAAGPSM